MPRRKSPADEQLFRHPIHMVPREVLTLVFREYMREFFSIPHNPASRPPAILHVCRYWKQAVI
jgi:hypothetical protein